MHPHHNLPSQIMKTKSMRSLLLRVITDYVKTSPSKAVAVTITAVKKKAANEPSTSSGTPLQIRLRSNGTELCTKAPPAKPMPAETSPPKLQLLDKTPQFWPCSAAANATSEAQKPPCSQRKRRRGECQCHTYKDQCTASNEAAAAGAEHSHASPAAAAPPPP